MLSLPPPTMSSVSFSAANLREPQLNSRLQDTRTHKGDQGGQEEGTRMVMTIRVFQILQ